MGSIVLLIPWKIAAKLAQIADHLSSVTARRPESPASAWQGVRAGGRERLERVRTGSLGTWRWRQG
ncbi:hypothetical protein AUL38_09205 [Leucobacter sp. G161]|nr:hypothetical protein AUL38_09205 [Leucobacter sp. G161]